MKDTCCTEEQLLRLRMIEQAAVRKGGGYGMRQKMDAMLLQFMREQDLETDAELSAKLAMIPTENPSMVMTEPIQGLELPSRAENALIADGLMTIGLVMTKREEELLKIKNFGHQSLQCVKSALHKRGLKLRS